MSFNAVSKTRVSRVRNSLFFKKKSLGKRNQESCEIPVGPITYVYKLNMVNRLVTHMTKTVTITKEEYDMLKKKEEIADDVIFQLSRSLSDMKKGRIKKSD